MVIAPTIAAMPLTLLQVVPGVQIGIAVVRATRPCVAFGATSFSAGTVVTLVDDDPETILQATIDGEEECANRASGVVTFRLSAEYPRAQIRRCTSSEGVHRTAWEEVPLKGRRIWHQYYDLGYDVEPSCEERDFAPNP